MSIELIDIGVNLADSVFQRDRDEVIARAMAAGITSMVITGSSIASSQSAAKIALSQPGLYSTAGVHPHDARHCDESTIGSLRKLASKTQVVAIGECGLDYNRNFSPRSLQDQWFFAQIKLACELDMPLFLHERDAHEKLVEILRGFDSLPPVVVHCFTGTKKQLETYLQMGFYIGITGWICDERRGMSLRELVKGIPLNRLMLETDAPYLAPRTMRPRPKRGRNEPAFLRYVLEMIAECMQIDAEKLAMASSETTRSFFRL